MTTGPKSPAQLRSSIEQRLKNRARETGQNQQRLRRQFVLARFLGVVFSSDRDGWVLKGGTGMMVRLPAGARFSKDIDLMSTTTTDTADAVESLRKILQQRPSDDPFVYVLTSTATLVNGGAKLNVRALLGATEFDSFSIDLITERGLIGAVEDHPLPTVIDLDTNAVAPVVIRVYPLADQVADKLCAMYELHLGQSGTPPGRSSNRYRDLIDLLLISQSLQLDLAGTVSAVEHQRRLRNEMTLPTSLRAPGPDWSTHWTNAAKDSPLDESVHKLGDAIKIAGKCYDTVLAALPTASLPATWDPAIQEWI